jgi:hypothetical protein
LQTKGKAPQGTFIQLFELCKDLKERDIGIGIAIPSISTNFSLMVKIAGLPETYCGEDITFVLKVFGAAIGKGFPIQSRFYAISASLFSIDFPFSNEKMVEFNSLVSILRKKFSKLDVKISKSEIDTMDRLTECDGKIK